MYTEECKIYDKRQYTAFIRYGLQPKRVFIQHGTNDVCMVFENNQHFRTAYAKYKNGLLDRLLEI